MTRLLYVREHRTEGAGALVITHKGAHEPFTGLLERDGWRCVGVGYASDDEAYRRALSLYGAHRYRCDYCKRYKPDVHYYEGQRLTKHTPLDFAGPLCPACAANEHIFDVRRPGAIVGVKPGKRRSRVGADKEKRAPKTAASARQQAPTDDESMPPLGPLFLL